MSYGVVTVDVYAISCKMVIFQHESNMYLNVKSITFYC